MRFIDTNIFIRYLTKDDPRKAEACFELFQKAKLGEEALTTSETVIGEVVFVLSAKDLYNLPRDEIRNRLYPLFSVPGLKLRHRKMYLRALDLYTAHPIDFEDALIIADMEHRSIKEVYSYDRELDRAATVKRLEP